MVKKVRFFEDKPAGKERPFSNITDFDKNYQDNFIRMVDARTFRCDFLQNKNERIDFVNEVICSLSFEIEYMVARPYKKAQFVLDEIASKIEAKKRKRTRCFEDGSFLSRGTGDEAAHINIVSSVDKCGIRSGSLDEEGYQTFSARQYAEKNYVYNIKNNQDNETKDFDTGFYDRCSKKDDAGQVDELVETNVAGEETPLFPRRFFPIKTSKSDDICCGPRYCVML